MSLPNVAVGEPILASTQNGLINHVNRSPGRAVFTSDGIWSVPPGVYKFRVYLCGGGGSRGGDAPFGEGDTKYGGDGGPSPLCSKDFAGVEIGTSYNITIGQGATSGTGGTSSFGTVLQSTGGHQGESGYSDYPQSGDRGTHTGELTHGNNRYIYPNNTSKGEGQGFGAGAQLLSVIPLVDLPAVDGICVIEW